MDIWRYVTTPLCARHQGIEDLTRVVISNEIYESLQRDSLISYEMTTSIRFCFPYDHVNSDSIAFKLTVVQQKMHGRHGPLAYDCTTRTTCRKVN